MKDVEIAALAGSQFNRVSRRQLVEHGVSEQTVDRRIRSGRLIVVEEGVFAVPPLDRADDWGKWKGATLTADDTFLSRISAGSAYGFWTLPRSYETVTRPGNGGPRRHGGLFVYRSATLDGDTTTLHGIPITSVSRTIFDPAGQVSEKALAWVVREAVRLGKISLPQLADSLGKYRGLRGSVPLGRVISRYSGLPLERARSGAEVRALETLRDAGVELPRLNCKVAGEEADLSWPEHRLIIEIDGGPFHQDVGEDARKEAVWTHAGWTVRRLPSDDVYDHRGHLLALAPEPNVPLPLFS